MEKQRDYGLDIENFAQQIATMQNRLRSLLQQAPGSLAAGVDVFIPSACKELGVASEELEVALEQLQHQNDRLAETLIQVRSEQQRYQELFDSLPEAYLVTTLEGCIQEANQAAGNLLGISSKFLIGKPLSVFVKESDRPLFRSELLRANGSLHGIKNGSSIKGHSLYKSPSSSQDSSGLIDNFKSLDARIFNSPTLNVASAGSYSPSDMSSGNGSAAADGSSSTGNTTQWQREWRLGLETRDQRSISVFCSMMVVCDSDRNPSSRRWLIREATTVPQTTVPQTLEQQNGSSPNLDRLVLHDRPLHVFERGDLIPLRPQFLWYVREGLIKLTTLSENNEEIVVSFLGAGMPFGIGMTSLMLYQVVAISKVQLVALSEAELNAAPHLAQLLFFKTSQRVCQMEKLLAIGGQRRVLDRLWGLLQLLKDLTGETIESGVRLKVRLTHDEIAKTCCSTRVTITRLLGELQQQGKIKFDEKYHLILLPEADPGADRVQGNLN